ncbi:unnamed protein product [Phytophthora fragariaefolia]|uniref:Unnamed protein product n=1 Tax=Phytophthora fragariaefolia TaxID=1490495 RepID=A0A9W7CRT4_9STRA|nr:unnamed protein product [Phytophthora fragariaefolia]
MTSEYPETSWKSNLDPSSHRVASMALSVDENYGMGQSVVSHFKKSKAAPWYNTTIYLGSNQVHWSNTCGTITAAIKESDHAELWTTVNTQIKTAGEYTTRKHQPWTRH